MTQPLRWGILSTANIARTFVRAMGGTRSSCVQAISSREYTRAFEFAKEHGIPRAFGSYDEMLASGEIDAVYNPLPNSLHAEWTIRAMEAGLPVLCEKPFTADAAEAREVAAASRRTGMPVAEAFMYRHHPLFDHVLDVVRGGGIGRVTTIRSSFAFFLESHDDAIAKPELAGGSLMDVGCYCVNFARLVTGLEPADVCAFERRDAVDETFVGIDETFVGIDETFVGIMRFPNGVLAEFDCGFENPEQRRAEILGTEGVIAIDNPWYPGDDKGRFLITRVDGSEEWVETPGGNPYTLEIEDFVRACRTHQPPRWPVEDAIANMAVIDSLYAAARGLICPRRDSSAEQGSAEK